MGRKEIVVNAVLGLILLGVFAVLVWVSVGALVLALYGVRLLVLHFLPDVPDEIWFLALLCWLFLTSVIGHLRKRFWANAFLSLAVLAIPFSGWLAGAAAENLPFLLCPVLLFFLIPMHRRLHLWECALGGAIVAVGLLRNLGILGTATISHWVEDGAYLGIFIWMAIQSRRGEFGRQSVDASAGA